MGWMEERRFDWVPVATDAISRLIDGTAMIIVTDSERAWFGKYLTIMLNKAEKKRPLLPIFNATDMLPHYERASRRGDLELIDNMLSLVFSDRYIFWYIGRSDESLAKLPKKRADSFLWIMDEEVQNSFFMRSADDFLDIKLMHMARLLDKTIDAVMFGKITL
jgi:hypothetical protein